MWRTIEEEDVINGAMIRLSRMHDGFNIATIVGVFDDKDEVWIARPYVYAHQHFSSKSGLIGVENFSMTRKRIVEPGTDIQVYQSVGFDGPRKRPIRTFLT